MAAQDGHEEKTGERAVTDASGGAAGDHTVVSVAEDSSDENKQPQDSTQPTLRDHLFAYFQLLFYAEPTWVDLALLALGTLCAAAAGTPFPLMGILFGQLVDDLNAATCAAEASPHGTSLQYGPAINRKVLRLVYIAVAAFALIYAYVLCWSVASQRLARRLRDRYFASLLRQEPAFFDTSHRSSAGEVSARLHADVQAVQSGTSEKVGIFVASLSFFVTAYVIAFVKEPRLAGMLISLVPAFLLLGLVGGAFVQKFSARVSDSVAAASSIASEALEHVGVVQVFGAGPRLEAKFARHMRAARDAGIAKTVASAVQAGGLYFVAYSANALAFWQGSRMVADAVAGKSDGATIGKIYTVVFILVDACVVLGSVAPLLPLFGGAASAFRRLRADIERQSRIDATSDKGQILPFDAPAAVSFEAVSFTYPSRPEKPVLRGVSLHFPAGKHTAIVGPSGSGKSTVAALLARLRDPTEGRITLAGVDLRDINVQCLRSFIGLVQQELSLLNRSILENIALGLVNSPNPAHAALQQILHGSHLADLVTATAAATHTTTTTTGDALLTAAHRHPDPRVAEVVELVLRAAELADVASFVDSLERGYATPVGAGGALLSGGQRQRVALARALVRSPRILLLDEATASLDSTSERRIQEAVERAASAVRDMTVVSIAHRLSTVRNADHIIVLQDGQVAEQGTYEQLIAMDGVFAHLASLQSLGRWDEDGNGSSQRGYGSSGSSSSSLTQADLAGKELVVAASQEEQPPDDADGVESGSQTTSTAAIPTAPLAQTLRSIASILRPSLLWLAVALFAATIVGGTFSGSGLIFGFTVGALNPCDHETSRILSLGRFFGGLLFMLAVIELVANFAAWSAFGLLAERLLYVLRVLSFRSLLEQPLDWHQSGGRSPSGLLAIITKDGAAVGGFSGSIIGTVFSIVVNFVAAIVLSHIIAWKIAVVCLVVVPVLLGAGVMQLRQLARYEARHADAHAQANGIAVEAVGSIQTIASLSLEQEVLGTYKRALHAPGRDMVVQSALANVWLALSNSTSFLVYAFAYWWGARLIMKGEYSQRQFFIILVAMLVSAQLWGQMFTLAPEFSRARTAAARIFGTISMGSSTRVDRLGPSDGGAVAAGAEPSEEDVEASGKSQPGSAAGGRGAHVAFDKVCFSYASRPDAPVLQDVSFTVRPGQFCGLVGPSGAGKSTILKLVQGIYTATSGTVSIDGVDLARSKQNDPIRDAIAIVPQDPALFDGSVRFNVGLGAPPGREATDAEIERACRLANMHDTIVALPGGYDTECGPRAAQLSGGQRQRLAIARALVRRPRLLLLDESTSALDAESERVLLESLESVVREGGVTVVAITHRLHTVRRADVIFVVDGGRVVDSGTHAELMERSESYRANAQQQMLQ